MLSACTRSPIPSHDEAARLAAWEWHMHEPRLRFSEHGGRLLGMRPGAGAWPIDDLRRGGLPQDLVALDVQLRDLLAGRIQRLRVIVRYRLLPAHGAGPMALKWLECEGVVAQRDAAGRALRLSGTVADVTQRPALRAGCPARAGNEPAPQPSAGLSHELRTPLHAILGLSQVLLTPRHEGSLPPEQAAHVRTIQASARRLLQRLAAVAGAPLAHAAAGVATDRADRGSTSQWLPGRHILVVDDEPVNRLIVRQLLEPAGCTVLEAHDGLQALSLWEHGRIDMVLMDIEMPGLNGIEVARRLASRAGELGRPRAPVLALTARGLPGDRDALLAQGMDGYLAKPFEYEALLDAVGELGRAQEALPEPPVSEAMRMDPAACGRHPQATS